MQSVIAYVCEFCPKRKARLSKGHAAAHKKQCYYNPERRACASCGHFMKARGRGEDWEEPTCAIDYFHPVNPDAPMKDRFRAECDKWHPQPLRQVVKQIRKRHKKG